MNLPELLSSWLRPKARKPRRHTKRPARPARLSLQSLEDRLVPTVVFDPRFGAESLAPPAGGAAQYTTLSSPPVYLIFWGSYWSTTAEGAANAATLRQEAQTILKSPYLSGLTEYGSNGQATFAGSWIDPGTAAADPPAGFKSGDLNTGNPSDPTGVLSFNAVQGEIVRAINYPNSQIGAPASQATITSSPIYVVVTDPNNAGGNGGYNTSGTYTTTNTPINVISVGTGFGKMADNFGLVFSHEMAEMMSDPTGDNQGVLVQPPDNLPSNLLGNPNKPANDPTNVTQIGDNEPEPNSQQHYGYRLNGVMVQPYWSNVYKAFIVPDGNSQRFDLAANWEFPVPNSTWAYFTGTYALTINGDQLANKNDTVSLDVVNNGIVNPLFSKNWVQATLNGQTVQFEPGAIRSIDVSTGGGTDTVSVLRTLTGVPVRIFAEGGGGTDTVYVGTGGSVQGIQGDVSLYNGLSYFHVLIDNSADSTDHPNVALSYDSLTGLSKGTINFGLSSVNTLAINGGNGNNTYNIDSPQGYLGDTLNTGKGSNTVNVKGTAYALNINGGVGSNDVVRIGNDGSLVGIYGDVSVANNSTSGHTSLVVDDYANPDQTATITSSSITGLSRGAINYTAAVPATAGNGVTSVTINGGGGANTFNVLSTAALAPLTINGGIGSNDTVQIGNSGSLAGIAGDVSVANKSGHTAVVVDDDADTVSRTATITSNSVTGLSAGAINYTTATIAGGDGVSSVTVDGGKAANTFNVLSTAAAAPLTINGGIGSNDTVQIGNSGSLAGISGDVKVANASGHTTLVVDDSNDLAGHSNVVLNGRSVTGLSQGAINYSGSISELDVYGSQGGNAFEVQSLSSLTNVNLYEGQTTDTVVQDGVFPNLHVFPPLM